MFLNDKQVIVGVERTLQEVGATPKWNKKNLHWVITHHTPEYTRQHRIDLAMTFVSSERIIRVDDVIKYTGMCFGFNVEFQISNRLKGKIIQDAFTFQLFINGKSFTECSKQLYQYQPPSIPVNYNTQILDMTKIQKIQNIKSNTLKNQQKNQTLKTNQELTSKTKTNSVLKQQKKSVEVALKGSHQELMRIMIEQKKRKKKLQKQLIP